MTPRQRRTSQRESNKCLQPGSPIACPVAVDSSIWDGASPPSPSLLGRGVHPKFECSPQTSSQGRSQHCLSLTLSHAATRSFGLGKQESQPKDCKEPGVQGWGWRQVRGTALHGAQAAVQGAGREVVFVHVHLGSDTCDPFHLLGDDQREEEAVGVEEGERDKW